MEGYLHINMLNASEAKFYLQTRVSGGKHRAIRHISYLVECLYRVERLGSNRKLSFKFPVSSSLPSILVTMVEMCIFCIVILFYISNFACN